MSALPLRRVLLLAVPLTLVLAGCNLGQGKSVAGPDLGQANPAVGEAPPAVEPATVISNRCTVDQLMATLPCQGEDAGSVCAPDASAAIPWNGSSTDAPQLTWTYPCNPDGYRVELRWGDTKLASAEITAVDPNVGGPAWRAPPRNDK
jgi:hypothetical protein